MKLDVAYIFERIAYMNHVPFHIYNEKQEIIFPSEEYENGAIWNTPEIHKNHTDNEKRRCGIFESQVESQIKYAYVNDAGSMYLIGPVLVNEIAVTAMRNFCRMAGLKVDKVPIPKYSYSNLFRMLEILYYLVTQEKLDWVDAFEDEALEPMEEGAKLSEVTEMFYQLDKTEQNHQHFSLEEERKMFDPIRNGDVEALKITTRDNKDNIERIGIMAKDNEKQIEYMVLSALTLAARAAMEGGLNPSIAYNVSDLYHQKIEQCKTMEDYMKVHAAMMKDFASRVAETKKKGHGIYYIEQSENYLLNHMFEPIRIGDIARQLGMNEAYLSRRFREEKGISMKAYLTRERLKGARNMLQYSDYSYAQIAEYCCFPSQSRFGELFRKEFGVTPAEFRRENKAETI